MKLKGIPIIEQHIEKFLFGAFALGLIGVVGWQLISRPSAVDMGTAKDLDPGMVDAKLKERAKVIGGMLREDATLEPDPFARQIPKVSDGFLQALAEGTAGPETLPRVASGIGNKLLPIDLGSDTWYFVPTVPPPTMVASVTQTADALAETALTQFPELASRFPGTDAPKDIVWTTASAIIQPAAILAQLRGSDASATPAKSQLPTPWFNDSLFVVDVVFEREEVLPDGSFGPARVVDPIPGQVSFRSRLGEKADAALQREVFTRLTDRPTQQLLLQPDFLPTRNNAFAPPELSTQAPEKQVDDESAQLAEQVRRFKADRNKKAAELKAIGGPLEDQPKGRAPEDGKGDKGDKGGKGGGGVGAPGGGTGLGGMSGDRGKGAPDEKNNARRIALTKQLAALDDKIGRFEAELKKLSPDAKVDSDDDGRISLAGDAPVLVWAHDIGVEPGKTYRYRAVVRVYNPFFARTRQLVKQQQDLAKSLVLESRPSDWSAPVEVTPPVAFFVTRARPGDGSLGLGSAQVEVYRLFDGKWRREEFTVAPGDRIGREMEPSRAAARDADPAKPAPAASGPVDFSTDWFVVDIIEDQTGDHRGLSEGQKPAIVVIERIGGGGRTELRDPLSDLAADDRKRLNRDWRMGGIG